MPHGNDDSSIILTSKMKLAAALCLLSLIIASASGSSELSKKYKDVVVDGKKVGGVPALQNYHACFFPKKYSKKDIQDVYARIMSFCEVDKAKDKTVKERCLQKFFPGSKLETFVYADDLKVLCRKAHFTGQYFIQQVQLMKMYSPSIKNVKDLNNSNVLYFTSIFPLIIAKAYKPNSKGIFKKGSQIYTYLSISSTYPDCDKEIQRSNAGHLYRYTALYSYDGKLVVDLKANNPPILEFADRNQKKQAVHAYELLKNDLEFRMCLVELNHAVLSITSPNLIDEFEKNFYKKVFPDATLVCFTSSEKFRAIESPELGDLVFPRSTIFKGESLATGKPISEKIPKEFKGVGFIMSTCVKGFEYEKGSIYLSVFYATKSKNVKMDLHLKLKLTFRIYSLIVQLYSSKGDIEHERIIKEIRAALKFAI